MTPARPGDSSGITSSDSTGIAALSVSDGQGTSGVVDPLWHVYRAWCATHDQPSADPASITSFLQACTGSPAQQARRRRELLNVEGIPSTPAPRVHAAAWRTGPDWLTLPDALRALPIHDSLHGPRARRDGVVLLLLGHLHLTKHAAATATAATWPLPALAGIDLPATADPHTCPGCVTTRWLRTLAHARLTLDDGPGLQEFDVHDCRYPVPEGWQHGPLLTPVDRHGTIQATGGAALAPRDLGRIAAYRQRAEWWPREHSQAPGPPAVLPPSMTPLEAAKARRALRELLDNPEAAN